MPSKTKSSKTVKKDRANMADMIQLHFEPEPTDMRKGRDSLASIVRQKFGKDPKMGGRAFNRIVLPKQGENLSAA